MEKRSAKANGDGQSIMVPEIHFGHLIKAEIERQGRRMSWFAKQMNTERSNIYKALKRSRLDSDFIAKASFLLHVDFFEKASEVLRSSEEWKNLP